MKRTDQWRYMLAVLFFASLWCGHLRGQSIFGFREEGEEMLLGDAHMAALGYGEIPGTISSTQCGSIAFLRSAGVDISYLGTRLEMSDNAGKNIMHYYGLPFITAATPLPRDFAFGFKISKTADFNSNFVVAPDSVNGELFQESFLKKGQLSMGNIELARRFSPNIGLGMGLNVVFGGSEEVWLTNFQDTTYRDTRDSLKSTYFGLSYALGFALKAQPLSVSLGYQFPIVCERSTRSQSYLRPDTTVREDDITFPGQFTLGADLMIGEVVNIVGTVRYRDWSNLKVDGSSTGRYQNVLSYSVGLEYNRSKGYKQREIPFRVGYFYKPWYFKDSYDNRIDDHGITVGSSIPVIQKDGYLDIALIAGRRKSRELEERFYSVQLGFNFYERW